MEAERRESDAGSTRTVASLCRGERTLGIAEGPTGSEAQLGDDNFARFIGHLSCEAMPRRNPVMDDDCVLRTCHLTIRRYAAVGAGRVPKSPVRTRTTQGTKRTGGS